MDGVCARKARGRELKDEMHRAVFKLVTGEAVAAPPRGPGLSILEGMHVQTSTYVRRSE
jgi:hypothetical protein